MELPQSTIDLIDEVREIFKELVTPFGHTSIGNDRAILAAMIQQNRILRDQGSLTHQINVQRNEILTQQLSLQFGEDDGPTYSEMETAIILSKLRSLERGDEVLVSLYVDGSKRRLRRCKVFTPVVTLSDTQGPDFYNKYNIPEDYIAAMLVTDHTGNITAIGFDFESSHWEFLDGHASESISDEFDHHNPDH